MLSTSFCDTLDSLSSVSVCLYSSVEGSSVAGVLGPVASGVLAMLPVDVGVLGSPISRSTGGFTTALVPKTLCNCEKNLKSSSIPSSSDSTPAPLLLCLSMMSLYFFFKAFSLSRHCFPLRLKPRVARAAAIFWNTESLRYAPFN